MLASSAMTAIHTFLLAAVFFLTSAISVVTGSTSAITVPVMFQFGMEPRAAVATNMFALTFLSAGGTLPFLRGGVLSRRRLPPLIAITLAGSAAGAMLLPVIPARMVPVFVSSAIIGLAVFSTIYRRAGVASDAGTSGPPMEGVGYLLTFLLGIYGGVFSGGYVTILTAVFVACFRMTFLEAIAATKLVNVFSSGIATLIFMGHGLVDYRLGLLLGAVMFVGALLGAGYARRLKETWLRRIYLAALWALALKTLLFDVLRPAHAGESGMPAR